MPLVNPFATSHISSRWVPLGRTLAPDFLGCDIFANHQHFLQHKAAAQLCAEKRMTVFLIPFAQTWCSVRKKIQFISNVCDTSCPRRSHPASVAINSSSCITSCRTCGEHPVRQDTSGWCRCGERPPEKNLRRQSRYLSNYYSSKAARFRNLGPPTATAGAENLEDTCS